MIRYSGGVMSDSSDSESEKSSEVRGRSLEIPPSPEQESYGDTSNDASLNRTSLNFATPCAQRSKLVKNKSMLQNVLLNELSTLSDSFKSARESVGDDALLSEDGSLNGSESLNGNNDQSAEDESLNVSNDQSAEDDSLNVSNDQSSMSDDNDCIEEEDSTFNQEQNEGKKSQFREGEAIETVESDVSAISVLDDSYQNISDSSELHDKSVAENLEDMHGYQPVKDLNIGNSSHALFHNDLPEDVEKLIMENPEDEQNVSHDFPDRYKMKLSKKLSCQKNEELDENWKTEDDEVCEFSKLSISESNDEPTASYDEINRELSNSKTFFADREDKQKPSVSNDTADHNFMDGACDSDNGAEAFQASPRRSSVVDLTQSESDASLHNSPEGASREKFLEQRKVEDIVREQSVVLHELNSNQMLLDSLQLHTLPDNGRNLMQKIEVLKRKKSALDRELEENYDYRAQKAELNLLDMKKKSGLTKQTSLNFMPIQVKEEPDEEEIRGGGSSSNRMPEWGDLPTADTTISHLGKKAMETHLNEKALTVEALAELHKSIKTCPSEDTHADDPKYLKVELLPHQKHGLAWMLWREKQKPSGGLLADDMGLGKTISMISLILKDMEESESDNSDEESSEDGSPPWISSKYSRMPKGGTLVVCPASVLNQWEAEIYKRVKKRYLTVEMYHGPKRETRPRRLAKADIVITTYALVSRESGVETAKNAYRKDPGPIFGIKWERVILDEAHMVRNHKSQMAMGVCELVAKHRWCLTGTPIQNKELDLYALLKFLRCSPFDDLTVWKKWVDNKSAAGMQRLNTMMKSLMLRRTKEQLSDRGDLQGLPDKTFEIIDVHLDPEELEVYEKIAEFSQSLFAQFLAQRAEKQQALDARYGFSTQPVWEQGASADNQFTTTAELAQMHRRMKGLDQVKSAEILVLLLRLRQICCHPSLVKKMVSDGDLDFEGVGDGVLDEVGLDVDLFNQMKNLNINESDVEDEKQDTEKQIKSRKLSESNPVFSLDRPSAKIRAVLDLLEEKFLDSDDKVIIVSQWTSMLDIIAEFLKQKNMKFEALTGKVPVDKRQEIVYDFNKAGRGPQILLLSLTAGGTGLNLIGGNHLLLVDIHWNPQLEAQACDRIYRIGQKKDVYVYKFVTVNTIEERIKLLQDRKLALADNVMTGTRNTQASKLTLDDLKMLFSVPKPASAPPGETTCDT